MHKLETMLWDAGAVMVRMGKHKLYEVNGVRITVSHGHKAAWQAEAVARAIRRAQRVG